MGSNSPYLDELIGKSVENAPNSNLPPFDITVPKETDSKELAKKIADKGVQPSSSSPYLDELLKTTPPPVVQPKEQTPSINISAYDPYALMGQLVPKVAPEKPKRPEEPVSFRQGEEESFVSKLIDKASSLFTSKTEQTARDVYRITLADELGVQPSQVDPDLVDAFRSGFGESATGLIRQVEGGKEYPRVSPEAMSELKVDQRLAMGAGGMAGDLPYMTLGAVAGGGGGPIGSMAGAFALPQGLRAYYAYKLDKGEVKSPKEFVEVLKQVVPATFKGVATGAATAAIGGGPLVEAATMTAVSASLEGRLPTVQDFADNAMLLVGFKGITNVARVAGRLKDVWVKTGRTPKDIVEDVKTDRKLGEALTGEGEIPEDVIAKAQAKVEDTEKAQAELAVKAAVAKKAAQPEELVKEELKVKGGRVKKIKEKIEEDQPPEASAETIEHTKRVSEANTYMQRQSARLMAKGEEVDTAKLLEEGMKLFDEGRLENGKVIEPKKEEKVSEAPKPKVIKRKKGEKVTEIKLAEPKDPITEVDEQTGAKRPKALNPTEHPFRDKDPAHTKQMTELLGQAMKPGASPETVTRYLINEVNRYLNGEEVEINKVRDALSQAAMQAEAFGHLFERPIDHTVWIDTVREAAKWARQADRSINKQSDFKLTSGIDPTEFFDRIKRLHPAVFPVRAQQMMANIAKQLRVSEVLDIFGGIGKIGGMKKYGFEGIISANELEPSWGGESTKVLHKKNGVDISTIGDSRKLKNKDNSVQAIFTSPTYGNAMALKSASKKDSYQAFAGGKLREGNTGGEVWGPVYEELHKDIYKEAFRVVRPGGYFVLNMKDKPVSAINQKNNWIPKKGSTVSVEDGVMKATDWHVRSLEEAGFRFVASTKFEEAPAITQQQKFGRQYTVGNEDIVILQKPLDRSTNKRSSGDVQLNMMIPVNELPKRVKDVLKSISKYIGEERIRIDESKIPPTYRPTVQGSNEWMDSFWDARDAKKFDLEHFLNRLKFRSGRALHEQRGQLRRDLMNYGKAGYKAIQYIDAEQASSGLADRMYYEMRTEAFSGVPSHLTIAVDAVDLINRLTDIYGYKTGTEFKAPKGMSAKNTAAIKGLLDYYLKMTPEERAIAEKASQTMSDHVKMWVDELVEAGLKSAEEGEILKSHKYMKIKSLNVQDLYDQKFGKGIMMGDRMVKSTDSGVDFLANDPISLLETDSRILYKETANRMFRRIQSQLTKQTLRDFDAEYLENPFVRFRENDPEKHKRTIPEGWIRDYYFKDGKLRTYYLEPDFALQLLGSGPHMSFELSRVLRNVFGVNLTRAMTVSTSAMWATTRGLTMDLAHTFFSARRFKEVKGDNPWADTVNWEPMDIKTERLYSRMVPKFIAQIGSDMAETFSDVLHRGPITGAYEKSGGVIPFLSMREQHYLGKGYAPPSAYNRTMDALSYWGQSMEMWNRVAVMNRTMKILASERGLSLEEAYKKKDLVMEATNVAVERLPYRQGGWLPKELDKIIGPFISAGYNATRTFARAATENPVDFAARLSNIAIPTVALTIGLTMFAKEVDRDVPEYLHTGSIVVPLPFESFSFIDDNGDKRYMLLRIPVDPNVATLYNVFRLSTRKALFETGALENEPDYSSLVDSITRSLPTDTPIGPTIAAWAAYFGNIDTWKMNKVVEEPIGFPRSNVEGMDKPEELNQLSKDIAARTGLSAPRLEAAAKQFGMPSNEYAWLFGRIYDNSMSDLDPKIKEEHLAQTLAKTPGFKNLFAVTVPRTYRTGNRIQMTEDEVYNRMVRDNKLSSDAKAFYWKGVGSELEIEKYIDSFEDKNVRESLERQKKFVEKVKDLPHRDSWVYNFNKSPEFKAEDYYKIWKTESSQEERTRLDREFDALLDAGYVSGTSSARFWEKYDELVIGQ